MQQVVVLTTNQTMRSIVAYAVVEAEVTQQLLVHKLVDMVEMDLSVVAVVAQAHQVLILAVLAVQVTAVQALMVQTEQEHLLVEVEAEQVIHQQLRLLQALLITAVMVVRVVAAVEVLVLVVRLAQAAAALSFSTTKELSCQ